MSKKTFLIILITCFALTATATLAAEDVRNAQTRLDQLGFDPGPIDGIMGPQTRAAIRDFQRDQGLAVTGRLDSRTRAALGILDSAEPYDEDQQSTSTTGVIPSGTLIDVRLNERLDSGDNRQGDTFTMTVSKSVVVNGRTLLPAGAQVIGVVSEVESAKRPQKGGKMVLSATALVRNGNRIPIDGHVTAEGDDMEGEGSIKEDLKEVAIGAGVGALIGGLAKGKGGALAGILIGGGGTFLATKGEQVELDVETPLLVRLRDQAVIR